MLKDNLVILRKLNGYSQEEVAELIGISRQAYSKWEKGETIPDIEKCAALAKAYNITVDSLISKNEIDGNITMPPAPVGKYLFGTVVVSERGQIVIPKAARELFGLNTGDRLIVLGDESEGIAIVKENVFLDKMNKILTLAAKDAKE